MDILVTESGEVAAMADVIQDTGAGFRLPDGAFYPPGLQLVVGVSVPEDLAGKRLNYANGAFMELDPLPVADKVPEEIDAIAAMVVLEQAGLITALDNWLTTQPRSTQEVFRRRQTWRRDNEILISGAAAMGITSAQLDALFVAADQLDI